MRPKRLTLGSANSLSEDLKYRIRFAAQTKGRFPAERIFHSARGFCGCAIKLAALTLAFNSGRGQELSFSPKLFEQAPAQLEDAITVSGSSGALFKFDYWGEIFGNLSGGVRRGGDYEGLVKISLTLDLQKLFQWNGMSFYASILYPHGNGITDGYVHDYDRLSGLDAYDTPRIFELWLQQTLFDGRFSIRLGQLTTDDSFFISNNSSLFINSTFGIIGTANHNIIAPTYPVAAGGIRLNYNITPSFYISAMAVDDNPGEQNFNDKYGTQLGPSRSHGVLSFFEAGYIPNPSGSSSGLAASYKLGGYYDSQFHPDIGRASSAHGDYAFYTIIDQPLYLARDSTNETPHGLSAFARISYAPDDRNAVEYYFDTGINYAGLITGRPKDTFGAAFSFERLGDGLSLASGAPVLSRHEHVIELTYLAILNNWFSLQPDFQYIINPGGVGRIQNAVVAGIRFNISF